MTVGFQVKSGVSPLTACWVSWKYGIHKCFSIKGLQVLYTFTNTHKLYRDAKLINYTDLHERHTISLIILKRSHRFVNGVGNHCSHSHITIKVEIGNYHTATSSRTIKLCQNQPCYSYDLSEKFLLKQFSKWLLIM